jgi:hypothetical protein
MSSFSVFLFEKTSFANVTVPKPALDITNVIFLPNFCNQLLGPLHGTFLTAGALAGPFTATVSFQQSGGAK